MKSSPSPFLASVALLSGLVLVACGGANDGGSSDDGQKQNQDQTQSQGQTQTPGQAPDAGTRQAKDCETQWRERQANMPVGLVKGYETIETLTGVVEPGLDEKVHSQSRDEVTALTEQEIVVATHTEYLIPNLGEADGEMRLTKENFMMLCIPEYGDAEADPEGLKRARITIEIDRDEDVAVRAGTFAVNYQKIHVAASPGTSEVFSEHWTMGAQSVVVKERYVVVSRTDAGESTRTTTRELIEYVAP